MLLNSCNDTKCNDRKKEEVIFQKLNITQIMEYRDINFCRFPMLNFKNRDIA